VWQLLSPSRPTLPGDACRAALELAKRARAAAAAQQQAEERVEKVVRELEAI
jgi:hypothetical protein